MSSLANAHRATRLRFIAFRHAYHLRRRPLSAVRRWRSLRVYGDGVPGNEAGSFPKFRRFSPTRSFFSEEVFLPQSSLANNLEVCPDAVSSRRPRDGSSSLL